jgi:prefoldin subunit 5
MSDSNMAVSEQAADMKEKMAEYSKFLRNVLRPDYQRASREEAKTREEISEYKDLLHRLSALEDGMAKHDMVDLGFEKVFCKAAVDNSSNVFVNVGMGFHVELTSNEARIAVEKRIRFLHDDLLKKQSEKSTIILSHIRSSETLLDQLGRELVRLQ